MKLTSQNVENLFKQCLSEKGTLIEGIIVQAKLDVSKHIEDITSLLSQLPDEYYESKGKGWSFYNAHIAKDGNEWSGMASTTEKLIVLGIAAHKIKYISSPKLWLTLPGEIPYFVILDKEKSA